MSNQSYNFEIDWSMIHQAKSAKKTTSKPSYQKPVRNYNKKLNTNLRHFTDRQETNPKSASSIFTGLIFIFVMSFMLFLSISVSHASNKNSQIIKKHREKDSSLFKDTMEKEMMNYFLSDPGVPNDRKELVRVIKTIQYIRYRVTRQDSLKSIAKKFGLSEETVALVNQMKTPDSIKTGAVIRIPNQEGRKIIVKPNDSIYKIAKRYSINWEKIADVNNLKQESLNSGMELFIPESRMTDFERNQFYDSNEFVWPVKGAISSYFGPRIDPFSGSYSYHSGIDIRNSSGIPVYPSMKGKVIFTGYDRLYGYNVIIRHSNGLKTRYGHLKKILIKKGDIVTSNNQIGVLGSTGRSTGPHLHFEVIVKGKSVDPLKYLNTSLLRF